MYENSVSFTFNNDDLIELKSLLKDELTLERFNIFIKDLKFHDIKSNTITLISPLHASVDVLNKQFKELMESKIAQFTKIKYSINFIAEDGIEAEKKEREDISNLNPKYSFDEFVVGGSNNFARNAAIAVAEKSDSSFNPLFIYGGVGLGKTHLIQAIGNYIKDNNPNTTVHYVTSETFLNEYVNSIRANNPDVFRKKYRSYDVLLIDDIQFFSEKEAIKEELFNTFNALYEKGKHIVFSSDRKPSELKGIEERLVSRFQWGLLADIKPPDYETRIAILQKKMENINLKIPYDVINLIAKSISTNIRELEGCYNTVVQTCILTGVEPTIDVANQAINRIMNSSNKKIININDVKALVANKYKIKVEEIDRQKRTKDIVLARQVAIYIARKLTDNSLPKLGEKFGGKDHSTIHHAIKKIEEKMKTDKELEEIVNILIEDLKR